MTDQEYRLSDAQMAQFIVNGYVTITPDLPAEFHAEVFAKHEEAFAAEGNPGNNLLPRIPLLRQVFEDPLTVGVLQSVVGEDYYLQPHRHPHYNPPKSEGQHMHQDSSKRWSHRTRYLLAFYYPQDVPLERGPSGIVPGSHFFNTPEGARSTEEMPLVTPAGTVTIANYELWHRAMPNTSDHNRYMDKFLFARMSEPQASSWRNEQADWPGAPAALPGDGPALQKMHEHIWHWHRGAGPVAAALPNVHVPAELLQALAADPERTAVAAAYDLAGLGTKAVPDLLAMLADECELRRGRAGYALSAIGAAAVEPLGAMLSHANPATRVAVAIVLGDIGLAAGPAAAELVKATKDPHEDVRRHAAEALGNVGQVAPTVAVPALMEALGDPHPRVRQEVTFALCRLGSWAVDAVDALEQVLDDENRYVHSDALCALERIGTPQAKDTLIKHLRPARWCPLTLQGRDGD